MKLIVTGSQTWTHRPSVHEPLDLLRTRHARPGSPLVVVNGLAERGLDAIVNGWTRLHPEDVLQVPFPADWGGPCADTCWAGHRRKNRYGLDYCPTAGHRRNQGMVDADADQVLAWASCCRRNRRGCPPGLHPSHGTADCVRRARRAGIPVSCCPQGMVW